MAVEVSRLTRETLAKHITRAQVPRQVINVLMDDPSGAGTGNIEVSRITRETIAEAPFFGQVVRQVVNVLMDDPSGVGTGNIEVSRITREIGMQVPAHVRVVRQIINVLMDDPSGAGSGAIEVSRITREILGRCIDNQVGWAPSIVEFFAHNWADNSELRTSYQTDIVQASTSLSEKRRILVDRPERSMKFRWSEAGRAEIDTLLVQLRRFSKEQMTLPLYMDQIEITATSLLGQGQVNADFSRGRYFKNTPILIVAIDHAGRPLSFETNTIAINEGTQAQMQTSLASTLEPGCHVIMPLIRVREKLRVDISNLNDRLANLVLEVDEVLGPNTIPATSCDTPPGFFVYEGDPIFCPQHNWAQPLTVTFLREGQEVRMGRSDVTYTRGPRHRVIHDIRFTVDRTDMWEVLRFFDSRRGRALPFWLIDYEQIWEVIDHIGGTVFLGIDPFGSFVAFQDEMTHIGLEYSDGVCSVHEIITIEDTGGQWRLTLKPGDELLAGKTINDVVRVGRARLCRNQSDEFVEQWRNTNVLQFNMRVIELFVEGDVTL